MPASIVVLDACVLYPAQVRSLLMYLAGEDLFRPRWTDAIHEEWMRNLRRDHPEIPLAKVERIRDLMNAHVPECLVTGYEEEIPWLVLPDADDRHVLAAAIQSKAESLVTFNLKDFPQATLATYKVEAVHPDEFVLRLLENDKEKVCAAAARHRKSLKNPPKSIDDYLAMLENAGFTRSRVVLRTFAGLL